MYKLLKLNLARNSLRYIIKNYDIKRIYLPYYLCNVIRLSILKENCKVIFYHLDDNFMPIIDFSEDEYILYPNYFGICDENVKILANKYPKLIVDNAHSFYSKPTGFATFNSARKFLPVYNGSYLWIKEANLDFNYDNNFHNPPQTEEEKIRIENNFSKEDIKFIKDDFLIDENNIKRRKKIFLKFHQEYSNQNLLRINPNLAYSPFCYPYLAKTEQEANELVSKLKNIGLTIYRYWNNLPQSYNEYKFYKRLVAIPII